MTKIEFMALMYTLESLHEEASADAALSVIKKIIREGEAENKRK